MADETVLSDEMLRQLIPVGEVDILVGVPSYNNADTMARVVEAIQTGLISAFPRDRTVLVNADGGSTDGTRDIVKATALERPAAVKAARTLRTLHRVSASYEGLPGRANALASIFAAAELLRAKACAVISPDTDAVAPEWVSALIQPIYRGECELVTPLYHRGKFDGLLISQVIAPLIRGVYGVRIKEPLGADFACSSRLTREYQALVENGRAPARAGYATEVWMATTAIRERYRICQTTLGPHLYAPRWKSNAAAVLQDALSPLFASLDLEPGWWQGVAGSEEPPLVGPPPPSSSEPARVDTARMFQSFRTGVQELAPIIQRILAPDTYRDIHALTEAADKEIRFSDELWVKAVYDVVASHHHSVIHRPHLIQAFTPLYLGRAGSFIQEHRDVDTPTLDHHLDALGAAYERLKPYLIECWNRTP